MDKGMGRDAGIFLVACLSGIASGMFGIGGGVLLVPLLGLLFSFSQHRAQGTSLVALIPPTGALALVAYASKGLVSWKTNLCSRKQPAQGPRWGESAPLNLFPARGAG